MRRLVAVAALALALTACEPAVDLTIPERQPGQVLLDQAGILDERVEQRLRAAGEGGRDIVALTYETEQAGRGEANRAGRRLLDEWDADLALVAVARPGDFTSTDADRRERVFGLEAVDAYDVPRGLREEIVETLVPPIARENDWPAVFLLAVDRLEDQLEGRVEGR